LALLFSDGSLLPSPSLLLPSLLLPEEGLDGESSPLCPSPALLPVLGFDELAASELELESPLLLSEFCDSDCEPPDDEEPLPELPDSDFLPFSLGLDEDFSELR
jgi:hypothetical protein